MNIELLQRAGFKETFHPDQIEKRAFWTKTLKAREMPYVREHLVEEGGAITEDTEVVVEVTPDGGVQMTVGPDYYEEPVPLESDEGFGLLRDAGVPV